MKKTGQSPNEEIVGDQQHRAFDELFHRSPNGGKPLSHDAGVAKQKEHGYHPGEKVLTPVAAGDVGKKTGIEKEQRDGKERSHQSLSVQRRDIFQPQKEHEAGKDTEQENTGGPYQRMGKVGSKRGMFHWGTSWDSSFSAVALDNTSGKAAARRRMRSGKKVDSSSRVFSG